MTLLALSVSNDDLAADILDRILPVSGIALERFSNLATALDRLRERKFDILIVDFEYPRVAVEFLAGARSLNSGKLPVTVALIGDRNKTRDVLDSGAHFVLYKPLSDGSVKGGLRAAAAVLNHERRHAYRVPVQAQVELTLPDTRKIEGILLDLSENGMEVLTAEPQSPGALVKLHFHLAAAKLDVDAHGQVAWANPNGETGVHFLDLNDATRGELRLWLEAAAAMQAREEESVPHCKLTDLSLGGCYVETDSPFPERSLVELCFATEESSFHAEGLVRIMHPGQGMGVEFPSRTPEQREQVGNLIDMLSSCTASKLELSVSPRALNADPRQFEDSASTANERLQDSLLELLRRGTRLQQDEFLAELRRQRTGESVAT